MRDLAKKNILVTGATSGIGKQLVERLIEMGANVAFCGRSEEKLSAFTSNLSPNSKLFYQAFDLTDLELIGGFVEQARDQLGPIDILINCAGANSSRAKVHEIDFVDMEFMLKVNMLAPMVFMQEVYKQSMQARSEGMMINVMSTVCDFSNEGIGAYTASKSAFDALAKVFRKEVREQGIKLCSIYPGGVDTPFRAAERPEYLVARDVVNAILFMAQQDANASVDELTIRPMIEKNYC